MAYRPKYRIRAAVATIALAALAACSMDLAPPARGLPGGGFLVQKQDFQALYDARGHLLRLLQDRNHDGRAEVVIL
ncbi:MAG TPA: hypothetical protein VLU41_17660, partial [Ideonella sp.]|nr:hypothetical protein [Ideonella sp.]